jgi:hypothetical protein
MRDVLILEISERSSRRSSSERNRTRSRSSMDKRGFGAQGRNRIVDDAIELKSLFRMVTFQCTRQCTQRLTA